MSEYGLIKEGQYVLIQRGDQQRIVLMNSQQIISFGKSQGQQDIQLKNVINQEYYSAFKAVPLLPSDSTGNNGSDSNKSGKGKQNKKVFSLEKCLEPAAKSFGQLFEVPTSLSSGKDNRNIFDDKSDPSQSLRQSDIVGLRDQGMSSKEILDSLITSSKSFAQKTEFSQEKYLKKKENKHGDVLLFVPTDLYQIADYYFKKDPFKILGLRPDTISQILSYANIHANGKYIVYENAGGILVASILQRLGGLGVLLHCHAGTNPQKQAVTYMNFSEENLKPLRNLDVFYLVRGRESSTSDKNGIEEAVVSSSSEIFLEEPLPKKPKLDENEVDMDIEVDADSNVESDKVISNDIKVEGTGRPLDKEKSKNSREENEKSLGLFSSSEFDSLVICAKEHPLSILKRLLPQVALSCPFVVYCAYPEPLMECYIWVKEQGFGVNMNIVDNWLRNIQVESERTHPEINMSSSGGYVLYGTYVRDS